MRNLIYHISILAMISMILGCKSTTQPENVADVVPDYMAMGDSISKKTFEALSEALKAKIAAEGFPAAISYCNTEAKTLTDTYASGSITIKRTSLKPRNPSNEPDEMEKKILENYQSAKENGDTLTPFLKTYVSEYTHYFKPILLQPMCMGCHGDPQKDIATETLKAIKEKYPNDKATGYKTGDVRGLWHITFK
ncbi:MAG: DUF3365 domain-containing protein [Chitinophagaceae bacterium]|jgi:hypothetical protein|nr:DUF3365 domain-containing protein [Chitinophagaceae bacterium]